MVTTVVETTSTIPAGSVIPVGAAVKGNDNARVRAIVGGVVGGLAALILLGVVAVFYIRRQRQKRIEKEFDGNFDPSATDKRSSTFNSIRGPVTTGDIGGTLPNVVNDDELLDDGMGGRLAPSVVGGGVISPFNLRQVTPPLPSPVSRTSADDPRRISSERAFYSGRVSPQTTGSSAYNPYANYGGYPASRRPISPSSSHPPSSFSYPSVNVYTNPDRPASPSSGSDYTPSQSSVTSSAKEREARSGYALSNPDPDANPFNGVTQEQRTSYIRTGPSLRSAARQDRDGEDLTEIPPTYDSVPKA